MSHFKKLGFMALDVLLLLVSPRHWHYLRNYLIPGRFDQVKPTVKKTASSASKKTPTNELATIILLPPHTDSPEAVAEMQSATLNRLENLGTPNVIIVSDHEKTRRAKYTGHLIPSSFSQLGQAVERSAAETLILINAGEILFDDSLERLCQSSNHCTWVRIWQQKATMCTQHKPPGYQDYYLKTWPYHQNWRLPRKEFLEGYQGTKNLRELTLNLIKQNKKFERIIKPLSFLPKEAHKQFHPEKDTITPKHSLDAVSVIIPTAGMNLPNKRTSLIKNLVSHLEKVEGLQLEVIIIHNKDFRESTELSHSPLDIKLISYDEQKFNLSQKVNMGADLASHEYLLILNDDIEPISQDWLERMVHCLKDPTVGTVGAQLLYPDGEIQHCGVAFRNGLPDHIFKKYPSKTTGPFYCTQTPYPYLALTGACLLTRRSLFNRVGGFETKLPVNYNDIDYCLKIESLDLYNIYQPLAKLIHFESFSREGTVHPFEKWFFRSKWSERVDLDDYYPASLFNVSPMNYEPIHRLTSLLSPSKGSSKQ